MLYSVRIGLVAHKMAPWVPDTMDPVLVKHYIFYQRPVLLTSDWWSILNVFEFNDFGNDNFSILFLVYSVTIFSILKPLFVIDCSS